MVGFKVQHLDTISSIFCCHRCSLLLRDPAQLSCGHRQCQLCIDEQKGDVIICPECHEKISREDSAPDRGFRNDMYKLDITCALCNWTGVLKDYLNHLNQNHPNPPCTYCNNKFSSVDDLFRHQQFNCERITINCPLEPLGCDEQIPRKDFPKHYLSARHQRAIINFIRQIGMKNHRPRTSMTLSELQGFNRLFDTLLTRTGTLNENVDRCETGRNQCENLLQFVIQKFSTIRKSIDDQNAFVNSMVSGQQTSEEEVLSTTQKLNDIILMSNDGTYIWPIKNIHEKMLAAQSGAQLSIDSPPFHSSPTGYKICLRLHLNGDDQSRGTHVSLYLVFMRGEFDAILSYPFCFKMIFALLDQTNQQDHITAILKPNVRSNAYRRPQSEITVADGISKFASLERLQRENNPYIRDDTMFIKTIIDFYNIEKEMVSYAINLSAALPTPMQEEMIREETARRRQT